MRPLVNFLNQGMLPVVGREHVVERLMGFWRDTLDAQGLRTTLLLGEAGTGKSCVIEAVAPAIIRNGGAVIHMKLYPESATSLAPLMARALGRTSATSNLLKIEQDEDLNSIITGLRRLAHLRPTLIIIEDMHLLGLDAERDFTYLLHSISDEPISLLCVARPLELRLRGLLERYLIDQIELHGLDTAAIEDIWHRLFDCDADAGAVRVLRDVTMGNPLALRSALRGALHERMIDQRAADGEWKLTTSPEAFATACERNVRLLSLGLASHVTSEELAVAGEFACLGEIFSRETAEALVSDGGSFIERLMFKGIISTTHTTATTLAGPGSTHPLLAFTHTLLHKHLVEQARPDTSKLVAMLAENRPLYSILPFQILAEHPIAEGIPASVLEEAIHRALAVASAVNATTDRELGTPVVEAADRLRLTGAPYWEPRQATLLEAQLLHHRLKMKSGRNLGDDYRKLNTELQELLQPLELDEEVARLHLYTYTHQLIASRRSDPTAVETVGRQVELLLEQFPALRSSRGYMLFLREAVVAARIYSQNDLIRTIEARVEALKLLENEAIYIEALVLIGPYYLDIYQTEAELQHRLELVEQIARYTSSRNIIFLWHRAIFLYEQARFREVVPALNQVVGDSQRRGLISQRIQIELMRECARIGMGCDMEMADREIRRIIDTTPPEYTSMISTSITTHVVGVAIYRGAYEWALGYLYQFSPQSNQFTDNLRLITAIVRGKSLEEILTLCRELSSPVAVALQLLLAGEPDAVKQLRGLLHLPLIHLDILTDRMIITETVAALAAQQPDHAAVKAFLADVRTSYDATLEWLAERELVAIMGPMLERSAWCMSPRKLEAWRKRIGAMEAVLNAEQDQAVDHRLHLSMLGTIEVTRPDGEIARPRGARLKTLLGVMVADRMLDSPLSNREFYCLAAGDDDIERARNTVYAAMYRLREIIGPETIRTDGETPQLDLERMQVNLLEAHRLLRESATAAREGSWIRAHTALRTVLNLVGREVAFPTLYDNFFEAAREEFENRLRRTIIAVGSGLLREGDAAHSEEILRLGTEALPEDEEIGELLQHALLASGKRTEVERVKMRGAGVEV